MELVAVSSQFRPHKRFFADNGSREKILYTAEYDSKGRLNLVESGKEDLYAYIQSHRDSVDIHVLLKRFAAGELDVMERVQGFYADCSDMPDTFADVLNLVRRGEEFFSSLPADERAKYNHSFAEFLAHFDQKSSTGDPGGTPAPDPDSDDVKKKGEIDE